MWDEPQQFVLVIAFLGMLLTQILGMLKQRQEAAKIEHDRQSKHSVCVRCCAILPSHAVFCGHCGRKLGSTFFTPDLKNAVQKFQEFGVSAKQAAESMKRFNDALNGSTFEKIQLRQGLHIGAAAWTCFDGKRHDFDLCTGLCTRCGGKGDETHFLDPKTQICVVCKKHLDDLLRRDYFHVVRE